MRNYNLENKTEREYFKQDFSPINYLLKNVRDAFVTSKNIKLAEKAYSRFFPFTPNATVVYLKLFQENVTSIRYGCTRQSLGKCLDVCIKGLQNSKSFGSFDIQNPEKCRIMLEVITETTPTVLRIVNPNLFNDHRFEPGITGLKLNIDGQSHYYLPTDAIIENQMSLSQALNYLLRRTHIRQMTDKISERIQILANEQKHELFFLKSRAFITFKDECLALYRGNTLWEDFNYETVLDQFVKSSHWLVDNMLEDGRFTYYYDCKDDNNKDHEHPGRKPPNLYYNDLRHCGGTITLLRAYVQTKDEKFLEAAKKAIGFSISISKDHDTKWGKAYHAYYNTKSKLGGSGLVLASLMHYKIITGSNEYDEYIKGYARHVISRMCESGELLGYYIHPGYHNGEPLTEMTDEERMNTFSFYYPGEALLALALFVNYFKGDDELVKTVEEATTKALDWIVNERPKIYSHLFTALPSDAWLMQAIEEWAERPERVKQEYLDFVYGDAEVLMDKMYTEDDSPYIDYHGAYYYNLGDHYFPDGARSEGLIAAYYLAKKMGNEEMAQKILNGCKLAAKSQFQLFNTEEYSYSHKNPKKSVNSIRFKATRQWIRVDSIQHVACFFIRLYWAENAMGT